MERLNKNSKASILELLEWFDLDLWANLAATEGRMIEKAKLALEKLGNVWIEL